MTQSSHSTGPATLNDYLAVLRRRKWIIVQTTVLVTVVALVVSLQQAKVFQASAAMLVGDQDISGAVTGLPLANSASDPIRRVQTQAKLARVPEVARSAAASAGVAGVTQKSLLENSSVKGSPDSDFLTFTVRNGDAAASAVLATAYANAYANFRLALDTSTIKRARRELESQIVLLRESGDKTSAVYGDLVTKAQQLRTMELLQERNSVVEPAEAGSQIAPTPKRSAVLGLLVGLLLGTAIAFLWEALDKRVRSEGEIEQRLGMPILSFLPEPPRHLRGAGRLAMMDEPGEVHAEAVRRLRTNVEFANLDGEARTIMITSSVEREGKSTTIANLAVALARAGRSVVLVDLDLRKPTIAHFFGYRGTAGITDVVLGKAMLDDVIVNIPLLSDPSKGATGRETRTARGRSSGELTVLPAGPAPASPGEFVGTLALAGVLEQLRGRFDLVLIDAPPICVVGDAMTLSARVDALIVVARLGVLQKSKLEELRRELASSPVRKLGVVVTGAPLDGAYASGGYGYGRDVVASSGDRTPAA
jgi:succinoglycan biosynthesis transport protein ExoP